MNNAFARRREEVAGINATVENSISGIRVAKAFQNLDNELEKFACSNNSFVDACRQSYRAMAEFFSGMDLLSNLIMVVVLLSGGLFAIYGQITPGQFASYIVFVSMFFNPIKRLIQFVEQYQTGMTGFKRFCEIMDEHPEDVYKRQAFYRGAGLHPGLERRGAPGEPRAPGGQADPLFPGCLWRAAARPFGARRPAGGRQI